MRLHNDDATKAVHQHIAQVDARVGVLATALRDLLISETLMTETLQFNAAGVITKDAGGFGFASIAVTNLTGQQITVTNLPPRDVAPTVGAGVALVAANKGATYNLAGPTLTIYGTAGGYVTVSLFAKPQPPCWG